MPRSPPSQSQAPATSLVARLRPLMRARKARLSIGEMVARIEGDGGLGPVLFVLTLPVLLPLPPGFTMVLALPLLVVALQIVIGRRRVWMPPLLARQAVNRRDLARLLHRVLPTVKRLEALVRPRLGFLTGRIGACVVGLACTLIALVLILPIPFANLAPSLALSLFALGLTRRDGLMILAGYALMAVAAAVIVLGVHGVMLAWHAVRALVAG